VENFRMSEFEKMKIFSSLSKTEVDKLSILEYLLENQNKNRILRHYYKIITRASIFTGFISLLFYLPVLFLFPIFDWFNPLGKPIDPSMHTLFSFVALFLAYFLIDILFRIYFAKLLSENNRSEIIQEIYDIIFCDDKGIKFFHYSSLRIYPSFLKLEINNLTDWFVAQNEMEDEV